MKKVVVVEDAAAIVNPLLGSDPEVFIISEELERVYPVLDLLGGTKDNPRPLRMEGYFVQEDNVLAEFNIPPAKSRSGFVANIDTGKKLLKEALPKGFIPFVKASHRFVKGQLDDPRAQVFGCTPDYNAWLGIEVENKSPNPENDPLLRSAGGHILLGYDKPNKEVNVAFVRLCDALLGVPSVILDQDVDRRKLYGKAGAFRHKPFGVEYRTLSSFWLGSDDLTAWVWDQAMKAVDLVNAGNYAIIANEPFIIDTINTANVKNARQFVKEFNIQMP